MINSISRVDTPLTAVLKRIDELMGMASNGLTNLCTSDSEIGLHNYNLGAFRTLMSLKAEIQGMIDEMVRKEEEE